MQDRVPVNPGRVLVTPENGGAAYYATLTRADNPTQKGTPLNKASLLKDATAAKFGLGTNAVPDDVFGVLSRFQNGLGNEYVWAKCRNTQLPKIVESTSVSKVAMFLRVGASTFTMQYADSVKMSGDSVVLVNPTTISGSVSQYASSYAAQTVGKYVVSAENGKVYKIAGAATEWYGDYIGQTGYLVSVEYETVSTVVGYVNSPNSNAYPVDDGYTYTPLGQLGDKTRMLTGSYKGTGKADTSNPNSLTFDFKPRVVFIFYASVNAAVGYDQGNALGTFIFNPYGLRNDAFTQYGYYATNVPENSRGYVYAKFEDATNTLYWYAGNAGYQANEGVGEYFYVALG